MVLSMQKIVLGISFIFLGMGGFYEGSLAAVAETQKIQLKMGLCADYPPFEFKKNGEILGFDVDLAHAIAEDLGVELVMQDMDYSALVPALQSRRIDFVISSMARTPERAKNLSFSDPYYFSELALVLKKGALFGAETDFRGKRVGVQLGSTMEKYAKAEASLHEGMTVLALGKNHLLIQEIKSGRLFGMVAEKIQAQAFVRANEDLKWAPLSGQGDGYAIAFKKEVPEQVWKSRFDGALKRLMRSSKMRVLRKKWLAS